MLELQVASSVRVLFVTVAARPMLNAAVIRLRAKRKLSCRFVFGLIFTFHSRSSGIKAVEISHTHESAGFDQHQESVALTITRYLKNGFLPALTWLVSTRRSFEKHFEPGICSQLALNGIQDTPNVTQE